MSLTDSFLPTWLPDGPRYVTSTPWSYAATSNPMRVRVLSSLEDQRDGAAVKVAYLAVLALLELEAGRELQERLDLVRVVVAKREEGSPEQVGTEVTGPIAELRDLVAQQRVGARTRRADVRVEVHRGCAAPCGAVMVLPDHSGWAGRPGPGHTGEVTRVRAPGSRCSSGRRGARPPRPPPSRRSPR